VSVEEEARLAGIHPHGMVVVAAQLAQAVIISQGFIYQ